jgi:hypothetical protein
MVRHANPKTVFHDFFEWKVATGAGRRTDLPVALNVFLSDFITIRQHSYE